MTPAPGASAALVRRLAPSLVAAGVERPIEVDQTNRSVVVDEAAIVKWFMPPVPAPHPGVDVLVRLRDAGFHEVPQLHGVEVVDGLVVATVSEFVAGAVDGWEWFVDELLAGDHDVVRSSARRIGELGGRLHRTLAAQTTTVDIDDEVGRCRALLERARPVSEAVDQRAARISALFDEVPSGGITTAIPIHGDLHVGQLLRSGARLVVTDFDGNPLLEPAARHTPRPPAVDVASLVQSVDHAGRVAQRRCASVDDALVAAAADDVVTSYRSVAGDLLDERLLPALRVAQELHELVYAAQHLPRWAYAPTATLRAMLL